MHDPDPRVVARARRGDLDAFEQLVRECQPDVFRFVLYVTRDRSTAEDVTQETFLRAFRFIGGFRGGSRFSSWLLRIARNCAVDELRRPRREIAIDAGTETVGRSYADPTARAELDAALASVSAEHRDSFLLAEVLGLSYQEVADVLGVRVGTVKSRMFRARQALSRALADEEDLG